MCVITRIVSKKNSSCQVNITMSLLLIEINISLFRGIIYLYDHDTKYCAARILRSIEDLHIKLYLPMMLCYHRVGLVELIHHLKKKPLPLFYYTISSQQICTFPL